MFSKRHWSALPFSVRVMFVVLPLSDVCIRSYFKVLLMMVYTSLPPLDGGTQKQDQKKIYVFVSLHLHAVQHASTNATVHALKHPIQGAQ